MAPESVLSSTVPVQRPGRPESESPLRRLRPARRSPGTADRCSAFRSVVLGAGAGGGCPLVEPFEQTSDNYRAGRAGPESACCPPEPPTENAKRKRRCATVESGVRRPSTPIISSTAISRRFPENATPGCGARLPFEMIASPLPGTSAELPPRAESHSDIDLTAHSLPPSAVVRKRGDALGPLS